MPERWVGCWRTRPQPAGAPFQTRLAHLRVVVIPVLRARLSYAARAPGNSDRRGRMSWPHS